MFSGHYCIVYNYEIFFNGIRSGWSFRVRFYVRIETDLKGFALRNVIWIAKGFRQMRRDKR